MRGSVPCSRAEQLPPPAAVPLHLLLQPLLSGLSLHLLDLDAVGFAAAHVQLMVSNAKLQDALVDS